MGLPACGSHSTYPEPGSLGDLLRGGSRFGLNPDHVGSGGLAKKHFVFLHVNNIISRLSTDTVEETL